ncbi:MAG TPA: VWA domain-containing protein [Vicinamibacterales bacterium]
MRSRTVPAMVVAAAVAVAAAALQAQEDAQQPDGFRFRAGVALINVPVTVTDDDGRFVTGLQRDDFVLYEDGVEQAITHFSSERVPVSLGLVVDTSGSMAGEKWQHAREAIERFLDLLGPEDEVFLYQFNTVPMLVQDWTNDRERLSAAMRRIAPRGGTAMYDALAEAVPMASSGRNRKKAIVLISDGNDTQSSASVSALRSMIRESELLVYAIGIDGEGGRVWTNAPPRRPPVRLPFPFPGSGRRRPWPFQPQIVIGGGQRIQIGSERVNAGALRELTDDSGGRTEIVRSSRDLGPATTNIADELSRQYFLAYPAAAERDGRWHTIRVEVRGDRYTVRARRGFMAT